MGFSEAFKGASEWLAGAEGGWVDHPADAGGETLFGLSRASYPDIDFDTLTPDGARAIYHRDYWAPNGCDELPELDALCLFDAVVLHGQLGARLYQRALGVADDGVIGPITRAAAHAAPDPLGPRGHLTDLAARRLVLMGQQSPAEVAAFGRGWALRILRLHTLALARCTQSAKPTEGLH